MPVLLGRPVTLGAPRPPLRVLPGTSVRERRVRPLSARRPCGRRRPSPPVLRLRPVTLGPFRRPGRVGSRSPVRRVLLRPLLPVLQRSSQTGPGKTVPSESSTLLEEGRRTFTPPQPVGRRPVLPETSRLVVERRDLVWEDGREEGWMDGWVGVGVGAPGHDDGGCSGTGTTVSVRTQITSTWTRRERIPLSYYPSPPWTEFRRDLFPRPSGLLTGGVG